MGGRGRLGGELKDRQVNDDLQEDWEVMVEEEDGEKETIVLKKIRNRERTLFKRGRRKKEHTKIM